MFLESNIYKIIGYKHILIFAYKTFCVCVFLYICVTKNHLPVERIVSSDPISRSAL